MKDYTIPRPEPIYIIPRPPMKQPTDEQALLGATVRGHTLRTWDEGFGPLWVYRESLGAVGVVRARTWEEANECVTDEIMHDADFNDPDNRPDKDGNLPDGVHFRSSGVPANEGLSSPLAAEDLNGSSLDRLTPELAAELEIEVELDDG